MFQSFRHCPAMQPAAQSCKNSLGPVDAAERWGSDAILWLAGAAFRGPSARLASPDPGAAAMRPAHASALKDPAPGSPKVLPLCNPLRAARRSASVDQLKPGGRLILALAASGCAHHLKTYGRRLRRKPPSASPRRIEIVKLALSRKRFSYNGKYFTFEKLRLAAQVIGSSPGGRDPASTRPAPKPSPRSGTMGPSHPSSPPEPETFRAGAPGGRGNYREAWKEGAGHPGKRRGLPCAGASLCRGNTEKSWRARERAESNMHLLRTRRAAGRLRRPHRAREGDRENRAGRRRGSKSNHRPTKRC